VTDRLAQIQARRAAITPGPWDATHRPQLAPENDPDILARERAEMGGEAGSAVWRGDSALWGSLWPNRNASADAEFIANAPEDVDALLAMVRERDAALERVEALCVEDEARQTVKAYATVDAIRAAITATEGDHA